MILFGAITGWLNVWLTPLWLLSVGTLAGLIILAILWGVLWLISREAANLAPGAITEGALLPVLWIVLGFAAFGVLGSFIVRDRDEVFNSLARLPYIGATPKEVLVKAAAPGQEPEPQAISLPFLGDEIRRIEIRSPEKLEMSTPPDEAGAVELLWNVAADEDFVWIRRSEAINPLAGSEIAGLVATNLGAEDAKVSFTLTTSPLHKEVIAIPITALAVVAPFLVFLFVRWAFPKTAAIAHAASKSEMAQPLYLVLAGLGFFLLTTFLFIPYHTFGEDIKILKDSGLTLIMVFCIFHAVWAASNSVAEEIEGRTALTVLSKPVSRRQFILGKFSGIAWTEFALFVMLGVWFLIIVAYKPIYDGRETAKFDPTWQNSFLEVARTIPGLVLAFFETLVFIAISVAISTRLQMLANVSICFAIYALGHLTPLIVQSNLNRFEPVDFIGRLIATVLPVLDHFNIQAAIAAGVAVPMKYLATAGLYCLIYCTIALMLALIMFEDRDLA